MDPPGMKRQRPPPDDDQFRGWSTPQVAVAPLMGGYGDPGLGVPPPTITGIVPPDDNEPPWKRAATGPKYQVTVLVPAVALGLLIGKQHSAMQELSNYSGARIRIQDFLDVADGCHERGVSLGGHWDNIAKAERMLLDKLKARRDSMAHDHGIEDGLDSGPDPVQMVRWLIPAEMCGMLIGKRGAGLQQITTDSGAKCRVSSEEEMPPHSPDRIVFIVGTMEQREKAIRMISTRIGGRGLDNLKALQVQIPIKTVGYILGHRGDHVRQIREQAGTKVQLRSLSESETGCGTIRVELEGTPAQMEAAKSLLQNRVNTWKATDGLGHDVDNEVALRFAMPRILAGHLIGKGGSIVKDLMNSTGTLIKVLQEDKSYTRSADDRPVLVVGTIKAVLDAQRKILDHLATAPAQLLSQAQNPLGTPQPVPGAEYGYAAYAAQYGYQDPLQQAYLTQQAGGDYAAAYNYAAYGYAAQQATGQQYPPYPSDPPPTAGSSYGYQSSYGYEGGLSAATPAQAPSSYTPQVSAHLMSSVSSPAAARETAGYGGAPYPPPSQPPRARSGVGGGGPPPPTSYSAPPRGPPPHTHRAPPGPPGYGAPPGPPPSGPPPRATGYSQYRGGQY